MQNIKTYESIAREAGACLFTNQGKFTCWFKAGDLDEPTMYDTAEEAYKACVLENGLLDNGPSWALAGL